MQPPDDLVVGIEGLGVGLDNVACVAAAVASVACDTRQSVPRDTEHAPILSSPTRLECLPLGPSNSPPGSATIHLWSKAFVNASRTIWFVIVACACGLRVGFRARCGESARALEA